MSYQVLARKWRPQRFVDVVGQQHVLMALANGLSMARIHHAYLFSGTRGVGKTSIARLFAKGLNCEQGVTATPCGQCECCREIEQGRFVDLIEIDAASRTKVEDTRELLDNVQYAPARGRYKVYLIDEVHMLSRHSFNALLKTLEEPPAHVKFLLATTDPQKLPVTILSRCLQFHLKALDVDLIREQLIKILQAEAIPCEIKALQLIARAAEGSMRDALSLTDQAIAMGQGQVNTDMVSQMLGLLDADQPIALVEALIAGDGSQLMAEVEHAAARGVDWETLLVEMLAVLHRIAMAQLLANPRSEEAQGTELRIYALARTLQPTDLQLFYQTLLVGRKELAYAPDRRMGVEMTLLRALAFHPKTESDEIEGDEADAEKKGAVISANRTVSVSVKENADALKSTETQPHEATAELPERTAQILQARSQLRQRQEDPNSKKAEPAALKTTQSAGSVTERLAAASELRAALPPKQRSQKPVEDKAEPYQWKAKIAEVPAAKDQTTTPKALRNALNEEKNPELAAKLASEAISRDEWAAEVNELELPKLVQQLALNAFKEVQSPDAVCLHLRPAQRHLNKPMVQQQLADAMSQRAGRPVSLKIVEDDDVSQRTPLEWRQAIYEEKLAQARQAMIADPAILTLQRLFDAVLDEESIRPL